MGNGDGERHLMSRISSCRHRKGGARRTQDIADGPVVSAEGGAGRRDGGGGNGPVVVWVPVDVILNPWRCSGDLVGREVVMHRVEPVHPVELVQMIVAVAVGSVSGLCVRSPGRESKQSDA